MADARTHDPADLLVGARIRMRRKSLGVSQGGLAEAAGVTFQQIQKYEHGTNRVSASTLLVIARKLECRGSDLLGEGEDEQVPSDPSVFRQMTTPGARELLDAYALLPARLRHTVLELTKAIASDV